MPARHKSIFASLPDFTSFAVNPYVQALIDGSHSATLPIHYSAPHLLGKAGQWRHHFATPPHQLYVEIGVHRGEVFAQAAQANPQAGFIGFEITFKRVVVTAQRVRAAQADNAMLVYGDARFLHEVFAPAELDGVLVFSPDPWSKKKRQAHNRLLDAAFLNNLLPVLKPGGFLWLKTDDAQYFARTAALAQELALAPVADPSGVLAQTLPSKFERYFRGQGLPIYEGKWAKSAGTSNRTAVC